MKRRQQISKPRRAARSLLALGLLAILLSGIVPLSSAAHGDTCQLACCAGRAEHAAGSCDGGSCDSGVLSHEDATLTATATQPAEQLCGLPKHLGAATLAGMQQTTAADSSAADSSSIHHARSHAETAHRRQRSDAIVVSVAVISKPCKPECSSGATTSSNQNSQRSAVLSRFQRPPPPASAVLCNTTDFRQQALDAIYRRCPPRGPPVTLSITA